jgi:NADH:ubiquinone oxidoreductase subunit 6 (subunit J)
VAVTAVLFWVFGIGAVVTGLLVFRLDSMAQVTFALLASFLFVAGEVVLLGLGYLGVVIVLMMVMEMEMVIMAVFMIMYMMNPAGLMPMSMFWSCSCCSARPCSPSGCSGRCPSSRS